MQLILFTHDVKNHKLDICWKVTPLNNQQLTLMFSCKSTSQNFNKICAKLIKQYVYAKSMGFKM